MTTSTATATGLTDSLGVEFLIGDTVTVSAWGGSVRLGDVNRRAVVVGVTAARNLVLETLQAFGDPIANGRSVRPGCLLVARRDGTLGHEGNRGARPIS